MPLYEGQIAVSADRTGAFAVAGQSFRKQVTVRIPAGLEPNGVIVVLPNICYLNITHNFAIKHHGEASGPAIIEHSRLGDTFRATYNDFCRLTILTYYSIASIAERISVLFHERDLFFELIGSPEVVAVQECHPFSLCFAEGTVAAHGCAAVMVVLDVTDF